MGTNSPDITALAQAPEAARADPNMAERRVQDERFAVDRIHASSVGLREGSMESAEE